MSLHSLRLKIGFFNEDHYEMFLPGKNNGFGELFEFVVRAMQISYNVTFDAGVSELLPNGTWKGMIGLLNRSEVDFVPGPFAVTDGRWDAVAFIYPHVCDELAFAVRKPRYSPHIMALFQTISWSVWLSLLMFAILVTLVGFVALKYRCTMEDVIFHVLSTSLNQQGTIMPQRAGEVLLLCTWMIAMTFFNFCFQSVLLSFLSFPTLSGVRTVPELAAAIRAGKYNAMTWDDYFPTHLRGSLNEDFKLIGENMLKTTPGDVDVFFNKSLKNPNLAFIGVRDSISFLEEKMYVSKDNMGTVLNAMAVRKDFYYKDEMDMLVQRFLAAGIRQKINNMRGFKHAFKHFSEMPDDDKARKITMTDLAGAFVLLVSGYCLSVCILIIELCIKHVGRYNFSTRGKNTTVKRRSFETTRKM